MAAYRRVYDSHHLQGDCQEPGSAPEPYARLSSMGTFLCTSTSIQFRRAGQQGPTRTLTAVLTRLIKQLLGTYSTSQVKYYK